MDIYEKEIFEVQLTKEYRKSISVSFAEAKMEAAQNENIEVNKVNIPTASMIPMLGITIKFARIEMTESLLKYIAVNGILPSCAAIDTEIKSKNFLNSGKIPVLFIVPENNG